MPKKTMNNLGGSLKNFLAHHLPNLRGLSAHTIFSYRDSLKLLLQFLSLNKKTHVSKLTIEDIDVTGIFAFLDHLEENRGNGIGTRNIRLAAIHSFFRYLGASYPEHLDQIQRVLNIPFKRGSTRPIEYLEFEEIQAILRSINRSTFDGRRDYVLLLLMFNSGVRVQEILDLKACDCHLTKPFSITVLGKGRKERTCPIWDETAHRLRDYMEEREIDSRKPLPVFVNRLNEPLSRYGVRYIMSKHIRNAAQTLVSLKKKRLHPHCMRHSTAVHLLKSGVDLASIANWLGHVSVNTTNKYVTLDLEMKRRVIEKAQPLDSTANPSISWKNDPDILEWLESL